MSLNIEQTRNLSNNEVLITRALYYRYSSWLLGYLIELVKDKDIAEQYLVDIFKEVPKHLEDFDGPDTLRWKNLRKLAQSKLRGVRVRNTNKDIMSSERIKFDGFVSNLTIEQQIVFCGVYYYQKSTSTLAQELNIADTDVKRLLKEAFTMIKNG
ncbi:RNA polymerase sigma factor [Mucilaginibacter terrae]|uniref:DNA-directed RNA polymerase specialized sigma24 family protein n=1 Tax=Mucilaginibacter terrae TaxID=1955052 RepID=A0ABU3GYL9_9SPHI|nr:hypothetical protein [Mucilaginibacter terrae]MDT3404865.1 DNA-directed RNA polymerase specialized sigma24 family protein [Mucilaginibacter terrae]